MFKEGFVVIHKLQEMLESHYGRLRNRWMPSPILLEPI
jgi:hypothetical protein